MVNKLYRFTNHILIQTINSLKYYTKIHTIYKKIHATLKVKDEMLLRKVVK